MKLSAQEEYGLRCLLQLGRRGEGGFITIPELSQLEGLSQANVAKIMRLLRRSGLVTSTRGQTGGYALARPAEDVIVADVLSALGGRLFDTGFCERHAGVGRVCNNLGDCSIRPVLRQLQEAVDHVLEGITLKNLLGTEREVLSWVGGLTAQPTQPGTA
jgi:Rrf2 family iron-sulfur cluster assembly transcriptional regulator